ncbi:NAD(P)-dependent alcohol dehydrogenase [Kitasatospora sp. NPDC101801]|uniref:zinc-dependent alcohol dehydrogenase family protein n=1 Tax=Kitasatospora sp. NPDC101801 TaxID=3364103 RepID=UPI00382C594D
MKSYHLTGTGTGAAGLTLREHEVPEPGPGQVLVRMRANAVSFRDGLILADDYPLPVVPGVVAGCEGAGEVVGVGPAVGTFGVGDRVALTVFPDWLDGPFGLDRAAQLGSSLDGALTEYRVVAERALVRIPGHLSYEEAAALPLTALTAWNALTGGRPLLPGEAVLTLGTGAVSLAAVQLALLAGARVIATTSGGPKAVRLKELGVHEVIDRTAEPDWHERVRELTGGRGADQVVHVAGPLEQSLRAAGIGAELAYVGFRVADAPTAPPVDARLLFASGVQVRSVAVGSRAQFTALNRALEVHGVRPVLDQVFPFAEVLAAFRYHREGGAFGRVVISHG